MTRLNAEYFRRNEKNLDNVGDAEKFYRPDPLSDSSEKGDDDDGDGDSVGRHLLPPSPLFLLIQWFENGFADKEIGRNAY